VAGHEAFFRKHKFSEFYLVFLEECVLITYAELKVGFGNVRDLQVQVEVSTAECQRPAFGG